MCLKTFVYGFKRTNTDKIDNYILIGRDSDEIQENDKLFNFRCIKLLNEEMEKKDFKIRGAPSMTLVKRNIFLKTSKCALKNTFTQIKTCACARCTISHPY